MEFSVQEEQNKFALTAWMEVIGDARPCGPGTWWILALLKQFWTCLHHLSDTCWVSLALLFLLGFALPLVPLSQPIPAVPALSPLPLPPCTLDLFTSTPRGLCVAAAAPAHAARPAGAAEQLCWCWQCRSVSLLGSSRMNKQTNQLHYWHSYAPKGSDQWMLLHNPSE